ncbi:MAG: dephospho-CoA kinase [Actinobacteria bacterium]|nr:dephospho-CoA kinase [Actinomycetota bacterium]
MILVGLTGGIGSGKSVVSAQLAAHGAVVIDADVIVRQLQQPGQVVLQRIVDDGQLPIGSLTTPARDSILHVR